MKVSTQTDVIFHFFGYEQGLKMFADAGFDTLDLSIFDIVLPESKYNADNWKETVMKMKDEADSLGISFNQAHAPFPSYIPENDEYNCVTEQRIKKSIEIAGILGAKQLIVHPTALKENQKEFNVEYYKKLAPFARKAGIKIALENMWGWSDELKKIIPNVCSTGKEFTEYIDAVGLEDFTACLDIGHSGLVLETAADMIRALGHDRLGALHVHDNDNINDLHRLPYTQKIAWESVIEALKEIDYQGDFTFEADQFLALFPNELKKDTLTFMNKVGRYFVDRITK